MTTAPGLARRLGTVDAVAIGLASMLGAGVFAALAPAAASAGAWLLLGLAIAAVVAICNALASAQLAAQFPSSGGSYVYGREVLGPWWGYLAGWGFVVGKAASCAAMALTFAAYAVPEPWQRPVAAAAVLALAIVNSLGVTRTAALAKVLLAVVLAVLLLVAIAGAASEQVAAAAPLGAPDPLGILGSAGLLFFAFAGYARIATMGEEVRDPARTIPRAIVVALGAALVLYLALAIVALRVLGPDGLAASSRPLADVVAAAGWGWATPVVQVGAAAAALGALLALIAGVGRTSLAMAREGDLPAVLARIRPRSRVPAVAELSLGVLVAVVVLLVDLRDAIGFSSLGVLVYYLVANLAALRQDAAHRRVPRALQVLGAVGCAVLVATLPPSSILVGAAVFAVGIVLRLVRLRLRRAP